MECEARLRGLWRIISSKTVIAVNVPTRGGSGGREVFVHHPRWLPRSEGGTPSRGGRGHDARAPVIGRSAACRRDACAPRHWRDALRAGATLTLPGEQLVRRGRSAACGRDACAPRGAGRCCCGRDACAPRQWRDALRAGATPAHPGSGGMRCMQTRRPRSQGSSSCGAVAALRAGATPAHPGVQGCATRSRAPALPDACSDKPVPHQGGR
jgi:hypothetical protein